MIEVEPSNLNSHYLQGEVMTALSFVNKDNKDTGVICLVLFRSFRKISHDYAFKNTLGYKVSV